MNVLGKNNIPESFEKYISLKQNRPDEWKRMEWDYQFEKQFAAQTSDELLKNGNSPIGIVDKLKGYSLNAEHERGAHKALVFEKALGYNQSNAEDLMKQIQKGLLRYKAKKKENIGYGDRAEVLMMVEGPNGKQPVVTGWIFDTGEFPRMVTAYVSDKFHRK